MSYKNTKKYYPPKPSNSPEILHPGVLPLEQSLKLQVGLALVEEDDLHVHVVAGRVEEVPEEGLDALVVDVAAHDDELAAVGSVVAGVPGVGEENISFFLSF